MVKASVFRDLPVFGKGLSGRLRRAGAAFAAFQKPDNFQIEK
jgi:hypothetical protein